MTVDATYINLFPSQQLFTNREIMKHGYNNINNYQQQQHVLNFGACNNNVQLDSTAMVQPFMMPFYQSNNVCDPNNKADSGITCHNNLPLQRKRFRDFTNELTSFEFSAHKRNKLSSQSSLLDQDVLYQIQNQQQIEIDRVLAYHAEKVRVKLHEQKMRQSRMLLATIQEAMANKLREKDEEIQRLLKINMTLQERVNSLCVENQIWKELAQTNETTVNCLRSNLEHVLAHADEDCHVADAQSSCGSNHEAEDGGDTAVGGGWNNNSMCKNCGVNESIVLLLPCKHLCLCTNCGSTIHNCPVCNSSIEASVHVNLSNY